jgi:hypothetical protein
MPRHYSSYPQKPLLFIGFVVENVDNSLYMRKTAVFDVDSAGDKTSFAAIKHIPSFFGVHITVPKGGC